MRSTRIGRKAQVEEHIIHVPTMLFVAYVFVALITVKLVFEAKKVDIEKTELSILANRLVHESSAYDKDTGRTYTGVIDKDAVKDENLQKSMHFGRERRLGIKAKAGEDGGTEINYNRKWFERLMPRAGYDTEKIEEEAYIVNDGEGKIMRIEAVT